MSERYIVVVKFHAGLGWVSEIIDTQGLRRILVAGVAHKERAQRRVRELNEAEPAAAPARPA